MAVRLKLQTMSPNVKAVLRKCYQLALRAQAICRLLVMARLAPNMGLTVRQKNNKSLGPITGVSALRLRHGRDNIEAIAAQVYLSALRAQAI